MHNLLNPLFIISLFVFVRAGDLAVTAAVARDTLRAVMYGITAILALAAVIVTLFGL